MDHDHKLKRSKVIKNITKKRKKLQFFFNEEYKVWQTWYGGKVDRRNEGIGVSSSLFFFSVNNI